MFERNEKQNCISDMRTLHGDILWKKMVKSDDRQKYGDISIKSIFESTKKVMKK